MTVVAENRSLQPLASFIPQLVNVPFKSGKHITGNSGSTRPPIPTTMRTATSIGQQYRQRDETCEPEEHRNRFRSENAIFVCGGWVSAGRDDEICDGEESPDGGEDQEVDLGGTPPPCPVVCSCACQQGAFEVERRSSIPYARTPRTMTANRA